MFRAVLILLALSVVLATAIPNRNGRIVGGRNALPGEMPFIASLRFWGTSFHFAGASLISDRWLVTIATPLVGRAANSIDIVVGTTMLNAGVVSRMSDAIRIHEQYNTVTRANDIGCVRSLTSITNTQFINIIPLGQNFIGNGVNAQVAGWGAINTDKGPDSNFLQIATVQTGVCVNNEFFSFTPQHLCARGQNIGICTTDVGGPLVSMNNQLIGIAVWHDPTRCAGTLLDGYLRISAYHSWLLNVIS